MNFKLLLRMLGILSLLIGLFMLVSLLWANPTIGFHADPNIVTDRFEVEGFRGLAYSRLICGVMGVVLSVLGRGAHGRLFRKVAMAVVGLSWVLATVLGALPVVFSGVQRGRAGRNMEAKSVNKLIDSASAFTATLKNVGPGLGTVGPSQNFGHFGIVSKLLFTFLMMIGRIEIFLILVLLVPTFWRDQ